MKAADLANGADEKARLRSMCKQLLSRAEVIKSSTQWPPRAITTAPQSTRSISKREEVILLEGSRLHGFLFPQWTLDPDDSVFNAMKKPAKYTYSSHYCSRKSDLTHAVSLST